MAASWNRQQVSYCRCSELKYVHAHCPCCYCNGKAVSRATEYRHWVEANLENSCTAHAQLDLNPQSNLATESSEFTYAIEDSMSTAIDLESPCTNYSPVEPDSSNINDVAESTLSTSLNDNELQLQSTDKVSSIYQSTFGEDIDKDIAIAVLRAFAIMDDMGGSQKSMLQILEFGRDCYCKEDHEMSKSWPNSWSACMKVLKKAGYKEPKHITFA